MLPPHETAALDRLDQSKVICNRCGATLTDYRDGEKCNADLADACEGYQFVESILTQKPN